MIIGGSRPLLVDAQRTMSTAIVTFHDNGKNKAGKRAKLAAKIPIDLRNPCLTFPIVEDSSFESRISNWLGRCNVNLVARAWAKIYKLVTHLDLCSFLHDHIGFG